MKLYDFGPAASAQRIRMFVAEKGLDLPMVEVNVLERTMFEEPFRSMNPFAVVPFLELDDGTCIGESVAICRYLDELHPEPSLMGRDARERAVIEMWNRRAELDGLVPMIHANRNANPLFKGRVVPGTRNDLVQVPEIVERGKAMLGILLERLEEQNDLGAPAVMVHNAPRSVRGAFLEVDPMELEKNFRVNVTALLYLARETLPAMVEAGKGVILVTGNTGATRGKATHGFFSSTRRSVRRAPGRRCFPTRPMSSSPTRSRSPRRCIMSRTRILRLGRSVWSYALLSRSGELLRDAP